MKITRIKVFLLAAAFLFAAGLVHFSSLPAVSGGNENSGAVVVAQKSDVVSLNPLLASDAASSRVYNRIFNGLFRYDENLRVTTALADNYEISLNLCLTIETAEVDAAYVKTVQSFLDGLILASNPFAGVLNDADAKKIRFRVEKTGQDSLTVNINTLNTILCKKIETMLPAKLKRSEYKPVVRIKLKSGVKWHDGLPFTADDVIFTFTVTQQSKKIPAYDIYNISSIEKIEKIDAENLFVVFSYTTPKIYDTLQIPIVPKHRLAGQDITNSRFNMNPIGTGPFKFVERSFDDYIILDCNENYFEKKPDIKRLIFRTIPNESIMFLELLQGNVDVMQLKSDQFVKFTQDSEFEKRFARIKIPELEYSYIGWNLKNRLFADENVRVALGYAIDKNTLIEKTLYNHGQICKGPFQSSSWACDPKVDNLAADIIKSEEMLKSSGWTMNKNEQILEKNFPVRSFFGYDDTTEVVRFEFSLFISAGNKDRELCASFIASELKRIGIKVNIKTLAWSELIKSLDNKTFDAFILTWALACDPDISNVWHSSQIPDPKNGKYGLNSISYSNPEVDRLLDEAKQTLDQQERKPKYQQVHRTIMNEQPYTFLYIADTLYAVSKRVKIQKLSPLGILHNIEKWDLEE